MGSGLRQFRWFVQAMHPYGHGCSCQPITTASGTSKIASFCSCKRTVIFLTGFLALLLMLVVGELSC